MHRAERHVIEDKKIGKLLEAHPDLKADENINLTEPESRLQQNGTGEYLQGFKGLDDTFTPKLPEPALATQWVEWALAQNPGLLSTCHRRKARKRSSSSSSARRKAASRGGRPAM